jgi:hypothetical protein
VNWSGTHRFSTHSKSTAHCERAECGCNALCGCMRARGLTGEARASHPARRPCFPRARPRGCMRLSPMLAGSCALALGGRAGRTYA